MGVAGLHCIFCHRPNFPTCHCEGDHKVDCGNLSLINRSNLKIPIRSPHFSPPHATQKFPQRLHLRYFFPRQPISPSPTRVGHSTFCFIRPTHIFSPASPLADCPHFFSSVPLGPPIRPPPAKIGKIAKLHSQIPSSPHFRKI